MMPAETQVEEEVIPVTDEDLLRILIDFKQFQGYDGRSATWSNASTPMSSVAAGAVTQLQEAAIFKNSG